MGQSFSQQALNVNAKMAVSRLSLMRSKKSSNLLSAMKRDIANLLAQGKVLNAEIKVESLIHEENLIIATEILDLHCEKIASRSAQIASQQKCPEDVFLSIATIVYCSTRLPVPEFKGIAAQMALKYTKAWLMPLNDRKQYVDPKVLALIDVTPPSRSDIILRLSEIASEYHVAYEPAKDEAVAAKPEHAKVAGSSPLPNPVQDNPSSLQIHENDASNSVIAVSPKSAPQHDQFQELEALKAAAAASFMGGPADLHELDLKVPEPASPAGVSGADVDLDDNKAGPGADGIQSRDDIDQLMKRLDALKST